ncbi:MAG: hypothetical protein ACRDRG_08840 [Pseudonocardiaceae bacterium]
MIGWLQAGIVGISGVAALTAVVDIVRDRLPGWWLLGVLGVLELALLTQAAVAIAQLVITERDVEVATFVGYLLGVLLLVPAGIVWALAERSRSGTAVIIVACLAVLAMLARLNDIWAGSHGV